jgi:subtilisin family serine protease
VSEAETEVGPDILSKRVLVRLQKDAIPQDFASLKWIKIVENIYAVELPVLDINRLASQEGVEYVEAGRQLSPTLVTSVPETRANEVVNPGGGVGFDGTGVAIGIIDFGLDFTLDDFRNPDGTTRLAFIWDQWLEAEGDERTPGNFGYGVEYNEAAINQALNQSNPFDAVRHEPEASSHGTHVAGIAAGNGRSGDEVFPSDTYVGAAPGATIIYVQPAATDQQTTFTDSVHVAEAVAYCFQRADELGLPCVINMSLGQNGGSHDGESVVERAIDRLLEQPGRGMVVAAGNEHIWRGHASSEVATEQRRELRWKTGGEMPLPGGGHLDPGFGDFTANEMEIWYSSRDNFRVRLIDPDGNQSDWVIPGETLADNFQDGNEIFIDSERFTILNGDARIYIEISPGSGNMLVKTGTWLVEIESIESMDGRFDAWIERDLRRGLNRFADQSFFVGLDFDSIRTLGTPATIRRGIAVANYDHNHESPSDSSGRGRTRDGRDKPEVAAPGTNIFSSNALGGRDDPNTGNPRPMRVEMSGTSMAAPHVAGITALLLQRNPELTAEQIKKILIASAEPPFSVEPFDRAWGYGKVDARRAMNLVDELT